MLAILIIPLICIALLRTILRFSEKSISFFEFIFWTLIWSSSIFFILIPNTSNYIASYLGIGRGADAIFLIAIIALLFIIFRLYIKIDTLDKTITELTINISKKIHQLDK